jgi:hypothetical protein
MNGGELIRYLQFSQVEVGLLVADSSPKRNLPEPADTPPMPQTIPGR